MRKVVACLEAHIKNNIKSVFANVIHIVYISRKCERNTLRKVNTPENLLTKEKYLQIFAQRFKDAWKYGWIRRYHQRKEQIARCHIRNLRYFICSAYRGAMRRRLLERDVELDGKIPVPGPSDIQLDCLFNHRNCRSPRVHHRKRFLPAPLSSRSSSVNVLCRIASLH